MKPYPLIILLFVLNCNLEKQIQENTKNPNSLNVLLVIADDLNCDLGTYGHKLVQSPTIDSLASQGVQFGNAHTQFPICGPSRASLMTGLYPDQTKLYENRIYLRQTIPYVTTIGERFKQEGYNSVRIGKIYHYDNPGAIGTSSFDDVYTWDYTFNPYGRDKKEEYKINTLVPNQYGATLSWLAAEGTDEEQTDGISATIASDLLEEFAANKQQFFLAVGLFRPHTPFVAPKKYFELYDLDDVELPPNPGQEYIESLPIPARHTIRAKPEQVNMKDSLSREIIQAYYATTSFVDAQLNRILKSLRETGLDKNTIVIFTSDHGYHLREHGHWKKATLFDNATRVPLIIAGPTIEKGLDIESSPIELVDLYPTIMDLMSFETPEFVSGISLLPVLNGTSTSVRKSALSQMKNGYTIKTDRYRLTRWGPNGQNGYELYDHYNDKKEMFNLVDNQEYLWVLDSLKLVMDHRIALANMVPKNLGMQIEGVQAMRKPPPIHSIPK
ncbi:MAG: sulfatase [Flavobacteriaceae bacterium]|nr:sulfatase [Flavobacteriaceae bacterium]MCY4268096.1 sulfatase [Flavobacteriaceae bacterium]